MAIPNATRDRAKRLGEPVALFLGRLGLTPDALTLVGFGVTAVGAGLLAAQAWLAGGLAIFAGGLFDLFDGTLARATGQASRFGAFLDSVFDRWGESLVFVGIVIGSLGAGFDPGAWLAAAALASAFMVSYTRARSEGLGFSPGRGMAAVGIMPREIRLVILTLGLAGAGLAGVAPAGLLGESTGPDPSRDTTGSLLLAGSLAIIAIGATITTVQRIVHTRAQARAEAAAGTAHPPAEAGDMVG